IIEPFTVTLSTFDMFVHGKSSTVWLRPDTPAEQKGVIQTLQSALQKAYPFCTEQSTRDGDSGGFHPHLTVASFGSTKDAERYIKLWQQNWQPISWKVDHFCIISRVGNIPFEVKFRIPIGRNKINYPIDSIGQYLDQKRLLDSSLAIE